MKYIALTGATGLLGSYLLKDLLRYDIPVVVLVRSSKIESARERVEAIVRRYERIFNRPLPRPIVFESNLHKPFLGLNKEQIEWFRLHVDTMLHNAASLSFVAEENGEPYRSNIDGTRNVLELCETAGIKRFHHVSTCYVCGKRREIIYESELDKGQEFGNDYEKSKFASETMVRSAKFIDSLTVFRPAIIVGDSVTGYTTTYHGFYAPIKILAPLIDPKTVDLDSVVVFGSAIGMNPDDNKNFVPVDWVSKIITTVVRNPKLHDSCYHLTGGNRVKIGEMSRCIASGIMEYKKDGKTIDMSAGAGFEIEKLLTLFQEQMTVYQAYWKDDPIFDMTNTCRAVPQFPPVKLDEKLMKNLVRFAIESHFGWPKPPRTVIDFDFDQKLRNSSETLANFNKTVDPDFEFGLCVSGKNGGEWTVVRNASGQVVFYPGIPYKDRSPIMRLNSSTFKKFIEDPNIEIPGSAFSWENGSVQNRSDALETLKLYLSKEKN